jgi:hypothetical protein
MLKRIFILSLCCFIALAFSTVSFSQEEPAETEETMEDAAVTPDTESPESEELSKEEVIATDAEKAASHFDGLNHYVNSRVKFELSVKDNLLADKVMYKIDEEEEKVYESPFRLMEEGKHNISYYGVDRVGNTEDMKYFKVVVDNTAPELSVTASQPVVKSGDKYYASQAFSFSVDAKDNASGVKQVEYSFDGTSYTEYVAPFTFNSTGDSSLQLKAMDNVLNKTEKHLLKVVDENGNPQELEGDSVAIYVDNTPPVVDIKADKEFMDKDGKKVASVDYTYEVTATDTESGVANLQVRLDGKGNFVKYTGPIKFSKNGEHLIEAKSIDKVGNESAVKLLSVYVDVIPPESMIRTVE